MVYQIILGRDEKDKEKFGTKGAVFLGKQYVMMGKEKSLANEMYLDVVRPHVILVSGKRGSGKCLVGDTLITLGDGSVKPIKDLKFDNNFVCSLNEELKIEKTHKSGFFKRIVDKILHIKLRSGKEIKLTPEHPLFTIKGWKPAQELTIGSRVATPRKSEVFGNNPLDEYKIKLLAYFIAEGHTKKGWVLFSNSDNDLVNEFKFCVQEFDGCLQVNLHGKRGCYRVANKNNRYGFRKNPMKTWLRSLDSYGYYAKEKIIPECVFKLPKKQLALFLNRLFSCDGSIYNNLSRNGWEIDYSSSSKKLIKQVQHLLLRFGVLSKLRHKKTKCNKKQFDSYELIIGANNISKFIEEIGFFGKKEKKQEICLSEIKDIINNPNVDTIPKEIWEFYRPDNWAEIGRAFGYAYPKAMRERIKYCPSRQTLLQIAQVDRHNGLYLLATSDIFWDEIVYMEQLEGKFEVYDISVPEFHNFVANDIIVHNSYTLSVIAESMTTLPKEVSDNLGILMLDTMGIFWTMKYPNYRDATILEEWDLKPEGCNVKVFVPYGVYESMKEEGIPVDEPFSISASEMSGIDWCNTLGMEPIEPMGILIERIIAKLTEAGKLYDIQDIITAVELDEKSEKKEKDAVANRFVAVKGWGIFTKEGTPLDKFITRGQATILDISRYAHMVGAFSIRAMVVGLVVKKLLEERIKVRKIEELAEIEKGWTFFDVHYGEQVKKMVPIVWVFIDEIHEFLPLKGETMATGPLIQVIREGRQPGVSMIVATQQPGKLHTDVLTQCDLVISHRITAKLDIEALNNIMHTYLAFNIVDYLNMLPNLKGCALVLDDKQERLFDIQVRPKHSWHGGESPTAMPPKPKFE